MVAPTNFLKKELPKGERNFPSRGERDLATPTKLHKDSLGKAPFCPRKLFPTELGWGYHLVLSPTRKVFFPLKKLFFEATWLEFPSFFLLVQLGLIFQVFFSLDSQIHFSLLSNLVGAIG